MPYTINYTDTVNKGTIIVVDNTLNSETTLSFPGRGTTAYGQAVNENFLTFTRKLCKHYCTVASCRRTTLV